MASIDSARRLLLVSNSSPYGGGYLDHIEDEIKDFLGNAERTVFAARSFPMWHIWAIVLQAAEATMASVELWTPQVTLALFN